MHANLEINENLKFSDTNDEVRRYNLDFDLEKAKKPQDSIVESEIMNLRSFL